MKKGLAVSTMSVLAGALTALLAGTAWAGPGGMGGPPGGFGGGPERHRFLPPPDAVMPGHDASTAADRRHFGRLSPEERRQLRRDIRNAGDDVYRRPPPAAYPYPPPEAPPPR